MNRVIWTTCMLTCIVMSQKAFTFAEDRPLTFNKEIAPIIFSNCTVCHRPGEAAPFSLQSYADVKKRGDLVENVVSERLMPPWKAGPSDFEFRHARSLTESEIESIVRWANAGMPEGEPKDLPKLPTYPKGWQLGEPDLVVSMKGSFVVPSEGPDIYRNFVIEIPASDEDRWVRAIEFRPSAPSVVHHSLFFLDSSGKARELDRAEPGAGFRGGMGAILRLRGNQPGPVAFDSGQPVLERIKQRREGTESRLNELNGRPKTKETENSFGTLGGWAIGAQPHELPAGLAFRIPPHADLILSTHFHPSGKHELEQSTVGLYFADRPPSQSFTGIQLPPAFGAFKDIDIPAGSDNFTIEDSFKLPCDVRAFGAGAHAHYLGKTMKLTATLPNGQLRVLLNIPDWDFAWQEQYQFADFVDLPKGTVLHAKITYDNTSANERNPTKPPQRVQFGEESTDEMGSMSLMVVAKMESDMSTLKAAYRKHFQESFRLESLLKLMKNRTTR